MDMADSADVVIVGAGPVGASLALALRASELSVAVVEARAPETTPTDPRPLALSHGSRLILGRLGVWGGLEPGTPIEAIHVSQQGGFGRVTLTAHEAGLPALGFVVNYAALAGELGRALRASAGRYKTSARVVRVHGSPSAVTVEFERSGTIHAVSAKLLVVADGGAVEGIARVKTHDYRQVALTAVATAELPHRNVAYERFTPGGPLALLPYGENLAVIWSCDPAAAQRLCQMHEREFLCELHRHFGDRLGRLTAAGGRAQYPLVLRYASEVVSERVVLVGNAAQTLHPVAGQGFNLGLRDAWELAGELARCPPGETGSGAMLAAYRARRLLDRKGGTWFTDALVRVFSNDILPLRLARGVGLAALDCAPPAKRFLARRMTFGARG